MKNIFDFIELNDDVSIEKVKNNDIFIKHTPTNNFVINTIKLSLDDDKKRYVILIKDITNEREIETLKEDFDWKKEVSIYKYHEGAYSVDCPDDLEGDHKKIE